jgi:hypothetical protein
MIANVKAKLYTFSLFGPKDGSSENEHDHRSNIVATRLYLILVVVILVGVSCFLKFKQSIATVILQHPSRGQFDALPVTADCACSQLSFSYGTFINLDTEIHPICSSDFIGDRWIRVLFHADTNGSQFYKADFRSTGSAHFQALASLCHQSAKRVADGLASFYSTSFVSSKVLHHDYLKSIVDTSVQRFQLTVPFTFQSQLRLINDMMLSNQLIPGLQNTFYLSDESASIYTGDIMPDYWTYNMTNNTDCQCASDFQCQEPVGFYAFDMSVSEMASLEPPELLLAIPRLQAGCTITGALLRSTLECVYNQTCVNMILAYLPSPENFTAMATNGNSVFQHNATVQDMIDRMMVEAWSYRLSYDQYFEQCRPMTCTYARVEGGEWLFILTRLVGLLGGLTLLLGILIPWMVRTIRDRKLSRHQPSMPGEWIDFI